MGFAPSVGNGGLSLIVKDKPGRRQTLFLALHVVFGNKGGHTLKVASGWGAFRSSSSSLPCLSFFVLLSRFSVWLSRGWTMRWMMDGWGALGGGFMELADDLPAGRAEGLVDRTAEGWKGRDEFLTTTYCPLF